MHLLIGVWQELLIVRPGQDQGDEALLEWHVGVRLPQPLNSQGS